MRCATWRITLSLGMVVLHGGPSLASPLASPVPSTAESGSLPSEVNDLSQADPSRLWPRLLPPSWDQSHVTAHIQGFDPVGRRIVLLWWVQNDGTQLLGRTRSSSAGHFDFGHIPILQAGQALTVTPEKGDPLSPTPIWIEKISH